MIRRIGQEMKIFIVGMGVFTVAILWAQEAQWFWQNPAPQGNVLNDLFVMDEAAVITVGNTGTITRTSDGGRSWQIIDSPVSVDLFAVQFTDSRTGWIAGAFGVLLGTNNSGNTWIQREVPTSESLHGILFINPDLGWIIGTDGTILKTMDAGTTWTTQTSGLEGAGVKGGLRSLHFVDTTHGWIVGQRNTILHTTDGGATWRTQDSGLTTGTLSVMNAVHFADRLNGWAVGSNGSIMTVIHTVDGGENWVEQEGFRGMEGTGNSIDFLNSSTGWIITDGGGVWRTIDGGGTWEMIAGMASDGPRSLQSVDFTDEEHGWVAGDHGAVLRTVDGGSSWAETTHGGTMDLNSVWFVDSETGWAAGEAGTILHTDDGGQTWVPQEVDPRGDLYCFEAVHFVDASRGWVVGISRDFDYAAARFTVDGGATWNRGGFIRESRLLNSVWFVDRDLGWVVGDAGFISHSISDGNWVEQGDGRRGGEIESDLESVYFHDANVGWIVGRNGVILNTMDGGIHWAHQESGLSKDDTTVLWSVHFVDRNTGWAVGSASQSSPILHTDDGGQTWDPHTIQIGPFSALNLSLEAVHFVDAETGWIVGQQGLIMRTTDGGSTWRFVSNPFQSPHDPTLKRLTDKWLKSVCFVGRDHGWAVGSGGAILRFGTSTPRVPLLNAGPTQTGWFRLTWPQDGNRWQLTAAADISSPHWLPVDMEPNDEAGLRWSVAVPRTEPRRFFRLSPPLSGE